MRIFWSVTLTVTRSFYFEVTQDGNELHFYFIYFFLLKDIISNALDERGF